MLMERYRAAVDELFAKDGVTLETLEKALTERSAGRLEPAFTGEDFIPYPVIGGEKED